MYLYRENTVADQLCSAPLFWQMQKSVFLMTWRISDGVYRAEKNTGYDQSLHS